MQGTVSANLSFSQSGKPDIRHSSMGRNGTFWTPPQNHSSNFADLVDNKKLPKPNKAPAANNCNSSKASAKNLDSPLSSLVQDRSVRFVKPIKNGRSIAARPLVQPTGGSHSVVQRNGIHFNVQTTISSKRLHASGNPLPHWSHIEKDTPRNATSSQVAKSCHAPIDPNAAKDRKDRRRHGGANNALSSIDVSLPSQNEFQSDEFDLHDRKTHSRINEMLEQVYRSSIPHIARLSREEYAFVRFSQDLPDGEKFSVKIEKRASEVYCFFISPDPSVRNLLKNSMNKTLTMFRDLFPPGMKFSGKICLSFRDLYSSNS